MFDKLQTKWLLIVYSSFVLIGIFILLIICATNLTPWGSLYGWLLPIPFSFIAIISYTLIPKILENFAKKKTNKSNKKQAVLFFSMLFYVLRYFFYAAPILISGAINDFKIDGIFNMIPVVVGIILIPASSIALNFLLFWIDYYKLKKDQKGKEYVPTGDSLKTN